jgi:hypothetical protein
VTTSSEAVFTGFSTSFTSTDLVPTSGFSSSFNKYCCSQSIRHKHYDLNYGRGVHKYDKR